MAVTVLKFVTGPLQVNTYLVYNENKRCLLIDPSSGCDPIINIVKKEQIVIEAILLTHGHFDHILGIMEIRNIFTDIPVYIHPSEKKMLKNSEYNESDMIGLNYTYNEETKDFSEGNMTIGSFNLQIFTISGHSPCGVAIYLEKFLFCGDILFAGSVGRSDLLGGDQAALIKGIKDKLLVLPDETIVCPGHMGRTTIGREKKSNPFL